MADETLQQYLVDELVEDCQHGRITRREALSLLGGLLGSTGAASLLAGCGPAADAAQPTADAPKGERNRGATRWPGSPSISRDGFVAGALCLEFSGIVPISHTRHSHPPPTTAAICPNFGQMARPDSCL